MLWFCRSIFIYVNIVSLLMPEQLFPYQQLADFTKSVFLKIGCSNEHADTATNALLSADLRGIDSHGVARLNGYVRLWEAKRVNATPNIKPTRGWFTSRFGYRGDPFTGKPDMHYGLDMAAAPGTPVMAPADGVVSYVGYESGYGKIVAIDHGFGVRTRYAHNSQIYVELGQKIKRRDVISAVGTTGRSSGPHLHYEVRVNDVPVDPINYILNE